MSQPVAMMGGMRTRVTPPAVVKPISFGIDPAMLERLDAAARRERVSRSVLIREMIADGLRQLDVGGPAPKR